MFRFLLNILFPPRCVNCAVCLTYQTDPTSYRAGEVNRLNWPICEICFSAISINLGFFCPICRRRLPDPKTVCHPGSKYILAAAASYQPKPVSELIWALKYQNTKTAIEPLREIIKKYLQTVKFRERVLTDDTVIIPVPLYKNKERKRGFNQAILIAELLAQLLDVRHPKIENDVLIRTKNTSSQTKLEDYNERVKNIADAFRIKNQDKIKDKNIILVDDVWTSGATINEAVRVLKEAGVKKIVAFVIAKA